MQQVDELAAALRCQRAGLSLEDLTVLLRGTRRERKALVAHQIRRLRAQQAQLAEAADFLAHVMTCRHPVIQECDTCRDFVRPPLKGR